MGNIRALSTANAFAADNVPLNGDDIDSTIEGVPIGPKRPIRFRLSEPIPSTTTYSPRLLGKTPIAGIGQIALGKSSVNVWTGSDFITVGALADKSGGLIEIVDGPPLTDSAEGAPVTNGENELVAVMFNALTAVPIQQVLDRFKMNLRLVN